MKIDPMQRLFILQIAMLAHGVMNAYNEAVGELVYPPWEDLPDAQVQVLINTVDFWLAAHDAPVSAAHDQWLAAALERGERLADNPNIRPFETLPLHARVREALVRGVVRATTRTQTLTQNVLSEEVPVLPTIKLLGGQLAREATINLSPTVSLDLDVVVANAQVASGLTEEEWNMISPIERDEYIDGTIGTMKIDAETHAMVGFTEEQFPTTPSIRPPRDEKGRITDAGALAMLGSTEEQFPTTPAVSAEPEGVK